MRRGEAMLDLARQAGVPDFSIGIEADVKASPVMCRPSAGITLPIWRDKIAAEIAGRAGEKRPREARLSAEQMQIAADLASMLFMYRESRPQRRSATRQARCPRRSNRSTPRVPAMRPAAPASSTSSTRSVSCWSSTSRSSRLARSASCRSRPSRCSSPAPRPRVLPSCRPRRRTVHRRPTHETPHCHRPRADRRPRRAGAGSSWLGPLELRRPSRTPRPEAAAAPSTAQAGLHVLDAPAGAPRPARQLPDLRDAADPRGVARARRPDESADAPALGARRRDGQRRNRRRRRRRELSRDLRAVGKIEYNESSLATITPRVDGYAERLFVNFTGVEIRKGDHLAEVYSPELLVAQQELLIALQAAGPATRSPRSAKTKLRLLGLTDEQIADLVEKKQITDRVTLYSPISGTVIEKSDRREQPRSRPATRSTASPTSTPCGSTWRSTSTTCRGCATDSRCGSPRRRSRGARSTGLVTFVQPIVNEQTRTVRVPVHVDNKDHALKPGMFVSARDRRGARPATGGPRRRASRASSRARCTHRCSRMRRAQCPICEMPLEQIPDGVGRRSGSARRARHVSHRRPSGAAKYFCPMKCEGEKTYDQPGNCPVCNMKLKEVPVVPAAAAQGSGRARRPRVRRCSTAGRGRSSTSRSRAGSSSRERSRSDHAQASTSRCSPGSPRASAW